jgi:mono/diheme cytochrome c family protein
MFATELTIFKFSQAKNGAVPILTVVAALLLSCSNLYADLEQGKIIYRENCAPCHGEAGKGDGLGARSLPARPADHTNAAVMNLRTDAFLRNVIAKGGSAMGLSAFMPAWQGIFKDNEIEDLVAYIRSLASPPK